MCNNHLQEITLTVKWLSQYATHFYSFMFWWCKQLPVHGEIIKDLIGDVILCITLADIISSTSRTFLVPWFNIIIFWYNNLWLLWLKYNIKVNPVFENMVPSTNKLNLSVYSTNDSIFAEVPDLYLLGNSCINIVKTSSHRCFFNKDNFVIILPVPKMFIKFGWKWKRS